MQNRNNPTISVIMPCYNSEKYIKEAIESILNQTYTNFEFLIFDDASTDKTVEIIKSYKDPRIILTEYTENKGYVRSLNDGLKLAKGLYIARMDSDDISVIERFEKQLTFIENNQNIDILSTSFKVIGTESFDVVFQQDIDIKSNIAILNCPIAHPTVFFKRSIITKTAIQYNSNFMPCEDINFWIELMESNFEIKIMPEILLHYRWHGNNISNNKTGKPFPAYIYAQERALKSFFKIELNKSERIGHYEFSKLYYDFSIKQKYILYISKYLSKILKNKMINNDSKNNVSIRFEKYLRYNCSKPDYLKQLLLCPYLFLFGYSIKDKIYFFIHKI